MRLFTITCLLAVATLLAAPQAYAQRIDAQLETSSRADFSDQTRSFTSDQTVHIRLQATGTDAVTIAVAPRGNGDALVLSPIAGDGFFAASIAAADLSATDKWAVLATVTVGDRTRRLTHPIRVGDGGRDDTDREVVEIEGVIEAVSNSSITVDGLEILVASSTRIKGPGDGVPTLADLEVGLYVEVLATPVADNQLEALRIRIRPDRDPNAVTASGRIEAIGPDARTVTVASMTFTVTDDTEILDRFGVAVEFSWLEVGMPVRIHGTIRDDVLVADEIRVHDSFSVRGRLIAEVTAGPGFAVAGVSFELDDRTRIQGQGPLPAPGTRVAVSYRFRPDGLLYAEHIRIVRSNDARDSLTGTVDLAGDALAVSGIRVAVTASTQIVDGEGNPVDLETGMRVRVLGDFSAGVVAAVIQTRTESEVTGVVANRLGDAMTIAGVAIALTDESLIIGLDGLPTGTERIESGQQVYVQAASGSAGLEAEVVTIVASSVSTGVDPAIDTPVAFQLQGNYPNPFNPTTTISFELAESAMVSLEVFDVTGRKVRTLASGMIPAGRHEAAWDGRATSGLAVTSGIYLYRLAVGDAAQTRSMLLVK